ncbi:MAG: DMT family transporter [bacterium]|nr:DMT family transporter [bacterium]
METWFLLSVISLFFAGFHAFLQKVGAARGYNSSLLNGYSAGISALIGFTFAGFYEGLGEFSGLLVFVAFLSGFVFIIGTNLRMDSLKNIDTTIFFPLHKFISPLIALIVGLVVFREALGFSEWVGVILGIVVPLFLIHSSEKQRQKNLSKGLILMVGSAVMSAVAISINKEGANLFTSIILFASLANAFTAILGMLFYRFRRSGLKNGDVELHYLDPKLLRLSILSGFIQILSFSSLIMAFSYGGALVIVYTINSLYILVPIVLSIILYKEHWNLRKAAAIVMSIAAVFLMK